MKGFLRSLSRVSVDLQAGSGKKRLLMGSFLLIAGLYDGWATFHAVHTGTVYYGFAHALHPVHMAASPRLYWLCIVGDSVLCVLFMAVGMLILKDASSGRTSRAAGGDS